jgi:hypothetical protein
MKITELIKILADLEKQQNPELDNSEQEKQDVMVSPLQQELELLKKATGVENMYDQPEEQELTIIKKNAGIPVQQIQRGEI